MTNAEVCHIRSWFKYDKPVLDLLKKGLRAEEVAARAGITERTVWRIKARQGQAIV
jgi:DNA-binding Xre family transcriptional regulator